MQHRVRTSSRSMGIVMAFAIGVPVTGALAQTPAPSFQAISVREGTGTRIPAHWEAERFVSAGVPLQTLLNWAYNVPLYEMANLPGWVRTTPWDINALASRAPSPAEQAAFVRILLEDRFRVIARVTTEDRPVYALTVDESKGTSPGRKASSVDCVTASSNDSSMCTVAVGPGVYTRRGVPMASLAAALRAALQREVLDHTGLTGMFDFDLHYRPLTPSSPAADDDRPDLQTAVKEQLGLRLQPGSAAVAVTVFDRIERPAPN